MPNRPDAWIKFETHSIDSLKKEHLLVGARGLRSTHLRPVTLAPKFALHAAGVFVGFAGVFRSNLSWARYWNGVTHMHFMHSKWSVLFSRMYLSPQQQWRALWPRAPTSVWTRWHASERDHNRHTRVPVLAIWQTPSSTWHERNSVSAVAR